MFLIHETKWNMNIRRNNFQILVRIIFSQWQRPLTFMSHIVIYAEHLFAFSTKFKYIILKIAHKWSPYWWAKSIFQQQLECIICRYPAPLHGSASNMVKSQLSWGNAHDPPKPLPASNEWWIINNMLFWTWESAVDWQGYPCLHQRGGSHNYLLTCYRDSLVRISLPRVSTQNWTGEPKVKWFF